jgi:hypothetical protein
MMPSIITAVTLAWGWQGRGLRESRSGISFMIINFTTQRHIEPNLGIFMTRALAVLAYVVSYHANIIAFLDFTVYAETFV